MRKLPLCQREEGFLKVSRIKLPDLDFPFKKNITLKECETECMRNCACSACTDLNVSGGKVCLMCFQDLIDIMAQPEMVRGEDIYIRVQISEFGKL